MHGITGLVQARHIRYGLLVLIAGLLLGFSPQNPKALRWFQKAVKAKTYETRVAAYEKAIELEPRFIEAYYNLGIAHKRANKLELAKTSFLNAYLKRPDRLKRDLKIKILFELATTYSRLGELQKSEETLLGLVGITDDAIILGQIHYELGRTLHALKRDVRAVKHLEKSKSYNAALRPGIDALIGRIQQESRLQDIYARVQESLKNEQHATASTLLKQIAAIDPAYRDIRDLQAQLQTAKASQDDERERREIYERSLKYAADGEYNRAIALLESLRARGGYLDADERLGKLYTRRSKEVKTGKVTGKYAQAQTAMRLENWSLAIRLLEEVLAISPSFRDAATQLELAQTGLSRDVRNKRLVKMYMTGARAQQAGDYATASREFETLYALEPDFRDVAKRIDEMRELAPARQPVMAPVPLNLDSLYEAGVALLAGGEYGEALQRFERIRRTDSGFRDIDDLLIQTRIEFTKNMPTTVAKPQGSIMNNRGMLFSGLIALFVLPALGFIALSPMTRARYHVLRGNYLSAARIYENVLANNPGRLNIYPALAHIYLLANREDQMALDIYRKVVQLNIQMEGRERIDEILTQKYLEGVPSTDKASIDILENMLRAAEGGKKRGSV